MVRFDGLGSRMVSEGAELCFLSSSFRSFSLPFPSRNVPQGTLLFLVKLVQLPTADAV